VGVEEFTGFPLEFAGILLEFCRKFTGILKDNKNANFEKAAKLALRNRSGILQEFHWNFRRWGVEFQKGCMHF
jgi:hypothetical protein